MESSSIIKLKRGSAREGRAIFGTNGRILWKCMLRLESGRTMQMQAAVNH